MPDVSVRTEKTVRRVKVADLRTAPAIQGAIVARRAVGQAKRKIARELGIARETVDNTLAAHFQGEPNPAIAEVAQALIPKALDSLDKAIPNDGNLAMRYLENTLFRDNAKGNVTFNDARLNVAIGMLPPARPTLTLSNNVTGPSNNVTSPTPPPIPTRQPTEAAEKDGRVTITVASRTNFSQTLEPAERFTGFDDIPG